MRRPRFRLRTLLLAVAAAALALGGVRAWQAREQRARAVRLAAFHAEKQEEYASYSISIIINRRRIEREAEAQAARAARKLVGTPGSKDLISLERFPVATVHVPLIPGIRPARGRLQADHSEKLALYHRRLHEKYEWLAAHPWASVPPDPPPP
jgi:hypothetical protein